MRASRLFWDETSHWSMEGAQLDDAGLVLYFGTRRMLAGGQLYEALQERFPEAHVLGCSTGGQLSGLDVSDDRLSAVAIAFDDTHLRAATAPIEGAAGSRAAGAAIGEALKARNLAGVFVLSDGINVNGSALVEGIAGEVGSHVPVSGGLAGDGEAFVATLVGCNGPPVSGQVAAIGFYGGAIRLGYGSAGGWDVFGPTRRITRSVGNVLFEVDGKPALDLYKLYLGPEDSQNLPGSALLFPLRIFNSRRPEEGVVRTIVAVDHKAASMTFAGDMPEGWSAQLMRGSFDRLSAGAAKATHLAVTGARLQQDTPSVAIFVSSVGRRLLMGQRIADEIEAANSELTPNCLSVGFYSYGEFSPNEVSGFAQLHNQTMTVTVLAEEVV
ncbi:FIST N-terminal domain-containing protein [Devosia sp. ZB163]|uniref:FIST signal transduction protein n=1 Tax=Devosia sp. ZB163 TaxID=3025938 RepID=UPI0023631652|nr:FIST N-terminal domain-containing protein [Devosia sp. ZB163]MDC9822443.1 FIST N-terminal domain-containing protein [Devosia sp. ZB163]